MPCGNSNSASGWVCFEDNWLHRLIAILIVKIELHSAVTGEVTTIATGKIVNTGTGSPSQGNYRIELRDAAGRMWKTGHIEGFPRKRLLAWDLLCRALEKLVGSRNVCRDSPLLYASGIRGPKMPHKATPTRGAGDDRSTSQPRYDPGAA